MYDLIIIGSGPAGLSAAVYGKRAGLNLLIIEEKEVIYMEEIIQFLAGILNREFIRAVFSNPRVKDNVVKAKLRPMEQKGELLFQLESFTKTQAFHKNLTVEETKDELAKLLEEFRQVQVDGIDQ